MDGYSDWDDLDDACRYCLVDAMDVVDVYRGAPDVIDGVLDAAGDRCLLVIPEVVAESANVCKRLDGRGQDELRALESAIMSGMALLGVRVEFARLSDEVLAAAAACLRRINARCAKPGRVGLSPVDCALFCAVAGSANVDIMTADKALCGTVGSECGAGRTCTSRKKYNDRNDRAARFIRVLAGTGHVSWQARNGTVAYYSRGVCVAVLDDAGDRWGAVRECSVGSPGAAAAIGTFYRTALLLPDDFCGCSLEGAGMSGCPCAYGDAADCGLDGDGVQKFLRALPGSERGEVLALARSFGGGT